MLNPTINHADTLGVARDPKFPYSGYSATGAYVEAESAAAFEEACTRADEVAAFFAPKQTQVIAALTEDEPIWRKGATLADLTGADL